MQRYRINYKLLAVLAIAMVLVPGAVYALWSWQIERNADQLKARIDAAIAAGNLRSAETDLAQYCHIRARDFDSRALLADLRADIGESADATMREVQIGYAALEQTLRSLPDERNDLRLKLRRRLFDKYYKVGAARDALDHLEVLKTEYPDDTQLLASEAICLFRIGQLDNALDLGYQLIGFDPESGEFDTASAAAPDQLDIYESVAVALNGDIFRQPDVAQKVMLQMVEANQDNADAYLRRALLRERLEPQKVLESGEEREVPPEIRADVEKAYALEPDDIRTVLAKAKIHGSDDDFDVARALLESALEEHMADERLHRTLTSLELQADQIDAALAAASRGIDAIGFPANYSLQLLKVDIFLQQKDLASVQATVKEMEAAGFSDTFPRYIRARVDVVNGNWLDAATEFESVRPALAAFPAIQTQLDLLLAFCREKLGQYDEAIKGYSMVLRSDPNEPRASAGIRRVQTRLNPTGERRTNELSELLEAERAKPSNRRNWNRVNERVEALIAQQEIPEWRTYLVWSHVAMAKDNFPQAYDLVRKARAAAPDEFLPARQLATVYQLDPDQGPTAALEYVVGELIPKFGHTLPIRLLESELLVNIGDEDIISQLDSLTYDMDEFRTAEKVALWMALGDKFSALRMREEAKRCWRSATEVAPRDLVPKMRLFATALSEMDLLAVKKWQDQIEELVGSRDDNTWLYTEASKLLAYVRNGQADRSLLDQARRHVERALEQRDEWHELHQLLGQIEALAGNEVRALTSFDRSHELGLADQPTLQAHVQLLLGRRQVGRARDLVERIPKNTRMAWLRRLNAQIMLDTENVEEAVETADYVRQTGASNAEEQLWYGVFMNQIARATPAGPKQDEYFQKGHAGLERAVELSPNVTGVWFELVRQLYFRRDMAGAEDAIRRAQLLVDADAIPLFLARCYALFGGVRVVDAENIYRGALEANPDNSMIMRNLAELYLSNRYQNADRVEKAKKAINGILRLQYEGKIADRDPNIIWARRTAAKILASSRDYRSLIKAEQLLTSNARNGRLTLADQLEMAQILAERPEPISRKKAIALLENVKRYGRLTVGGEVILGKLYFAVGDWDKAREQMRLNVIARQGDKPLVWHEYLRMLLKREEWNEAERALRNLRNIDPKGTATLELTARVLVEKGETQRARQVLSELLPRSLSDIDKQERQRRLAAIERVARLFTDLGLTDDAENIYRKLHQLSPATTLSLAEFLGLHGDAEEAFALLKKFRDTLSNASLPRNAVIEKGLRIIGRRGNEIDPSFARTVGRWLESELRENPDSIPLMIFQARFFEILEEYPKARDTYLALLERPGLRGVHRAIVLNNLGFLLASVDLAPGDADRAAELVDEAVGILGPTTDILDTRGMVRLAQGRVDEAISDLELSVTDKPTAEKYFHLVEAYLAANRNEDAVLAWSEAEKLQLSPASLNGMQRPRYESTKEKIDGIRQNEGTRA